MCLTDMKLHVSEAVLPENEHKLNKILDKSCSTTMNSLGSFLEVICVKGELIKRAPEGAVPS